MTIPHSSRIPSKTMSTGVGVLAAHVSPVTVIAGVPAERFEREPSPCRPMIEIDDSGKDTVIPWMKRRLELADLLGLLLHHAADDGV
jgi:hypothetical protein